MRDVVCAGLVVTLARAEAPNVVAGLSALVAAPTGLTRLVCDLEFVKHDHSVLVRSLTRNTQLLEVTISSGDPDARTFRSGRWCVV
jgi:hypothetical protein